MVSARSDGARRAAARRLLLAAVCCALPALAGEPRRGPHAAGELCAGGLGDGCRAADGCWAGPSSSAASCSEREGDRLSLLQSTLRVEQRQLLQQPTLSGAFAVNGTHSSPGTVTAQGGFPGHRESELIDSASVAYVLVCTALVQLMTPGVAFFYGGLERSTSILTLMMQIYISMGISTVLWYLLVFSLCFGETWGFVGSPLTYFFMQNMSHETPLLAGGLSVAINSNIPGLLFVAYQGMFATLAPVVITGAFADRFLFKPYLVFLCLWPIFVYAPWCHWIWGGGFLMQWGVWDFAGGIVVHTTGGFSALASLFVVGSRPESVRKELPHNVPFVALGTALLWFGWLGFNSGSALSTGSVAVLATANSEIAASTGLFTWTMIDWVRIGRPNLIGACVGAIAGLSVITPTAGYVQMVTAMLLGAVATCFCYICCTVLQRSKIDDAFDVWGVHGMGGFLGSVLLGLVADPPECLDASSAPPWCANPGTLVRSPSQFGKQAAATCCCAVYSFVVTWLLLKAIDAFIPLKPGEHIVGGLNMDLHQHGQQAYSNRPPAKLVREAPQLSSGARFYVRRTRSDMPPTSSPTASTASAQEQPLAMY